MDEMDFRIVQLLLVNSRQSIREIAEKLELSNQAVHRRIAALEGTDSIQRYYAVPSLKALGITIAFFFGKSNNTSSDDLIEKLSKHESIYAVFVAAGNMIYTACWIRNMTELDEITEFIKKEGEIPDLDMGLFPSEPIYTQGKAKGPKTDAKPLSSLDYKIINCLHHDTRKPIADIADELGVAARTVNRHLNRMMEEGLIELTIWFHPRDSGYMTAVYHINLSEEANKADAANALLNSYGAKINVMGTFSNKPSLIIMVLHIKTGQEVEHIQRDIENENFSSSIETHFIYKGDRFHTWRDDILKLIKA
jgi:Lrp/AsnC family leucine-responsive transcriptional regulator